MGRRFSAACTYPDSAYLFYRARGSAPLILFLIIDPPPRYSRRRWQDCSQLGRFDTLAPQLIAEVRPCLLSKFISKPALHW
jgi:hypothetical protein